MLYWNEEDTSIQMFLHIFTFQTPIIYDNSALQAELLIYKGDLSVKSNSYLITFKDADLLGRHLKCKKV